MPFSNLDHKKIYYYVICVMTFFVLLWGAIDLASSSIGLINLHRSAQNISLPSDESPLPPEKGDQTFDFYYQDKMLQDRFWDSLVRVLLSGAIFVYCRYTIEKLEDKA